VLETGDSRGLGKGDVKNTPRYIMTSRLIVNHGGRRSEGHKRMFNTQSYHGSVVTEAVLATVWDLRLGPRSHKNICPGDLRVVDVHQQGGVVQHLAFAIIAGYNTDKHSIPT